jgi:toxin ParE1/3/4
MGRERPEIREGLQSLPKEHHIIFYRIHDGRIRFVRMLLGARDLARQFDVS